MADRPEDVISVHDNIQKQPIQAGGHTTFTFKVEQSKILEFFGQKAKDTITELNFMRRINNLTKTSNLTDTVTYNNTHPDLPPQQKPKTSTALEPSIPS
jgi:hypothetical protein